MTFVTQAAFEKNLANQVTMTPDTLRQLRNYGVTSGKNLKLEFFFYTDKPASGAALAAELQAKEYSVEHCASASDKKLTVITGWSTPVPMSDESVLAWTKEMCHVGYKHDCEFDGWGTNPSQ
jgi:hypothetical protein